MPDRTDWPHPFCNRFCHDAFQGDDRCCLPASRVLDCDEPHPHTNACPSLSWTVAAAKFGFCAHCGVTLGASATREHPKSLSPTATR